MLPLKLQRRGLGLAIGLVSLAGSAQATMPSWQDLFSGLAPFVDEEEQALEEESARLGFVQVGNNTYEWMKKSFEMILRSSCVRLRACTYNYACFTCVLEWSGNYYHPIPSYPIKKEIAVSLGLARILLKMHSKSACNEIKRITCVRNVLSFFSHGKKESICSSSKNAAF